MSTFDLAIPVILAHEGGWVSNPADPGGETNYGISTLIIRREGITAEKLGIDPATMFQPGYLKPMKVDAAKAIYKEYFWDKFGYGRLNDQTVATKVFDCSVNCGQRRAHVLAQRACPPLVTDGILGPASVAAINALDPKRFVTQMAEEMKKYYATIIVANPKLKVFEKNWMHRAQWGVQP